MSSSSSPAKKRAALYLRISKRDGSQTEKNQCRQLRAFIQEEEYTFAGEYA